MQTAHLLAAIGLTELGLGEVEAQQSGQRWQAVAANTTGRRMALLVGINRYRSSGQAIANLTGCHQDVELQRQLLQQSFGFEANQITTVLDEAATVDRLDAELQRLAILLKPEDSLVLHFSGYGTQYLGTDSEVEASATEVEGDRTERAIVMADAIAVSLTDLSDRLRSLPTRNVIATIDASYTLPTPCRQESRSRVLPDSAVIPALNAISPQSRPQAKQPRRDPASRPVIITYAPSGLSTERRWSDFDAGVLTYVFTQSLWHLGNTANWNSALAMTVERIEQSLGSSPSLQNQHHQTIEPWTNSAIDTGIIPMTPASTIGSVVSHSSERSGELELWLGGVPPSVLSSYAAGSIVTVDRSSIALPTAPLPTAPLPTATTSPTPQAPSPTTAPDASARVTPAPETGLNPAPTPDNRDTWLRIDRDRGLRRIAHPLQTITESLIDRPIFEVVRVIPRSVQLGVALEPHLSRIERVDATSALSGLRGIEAITSSDRESDCWFGCTTNCDVVTPHAGLDNAANLDPDRPQTTEAETNWRKRYTLLAFDRQPIFDCPLEPDEAIKRTIRRLQPRLQDLRAFKILAATENASASMLKVRLTYGLVQTDPTEPDRGLRRTIQTTAVTNAASPRNRNHSALELPTGSRIQYRLENLSDQPLFFILVRLDSCGRLTIPDTDERTILPRNVLTVPDRPEATAWNVERDPGLVRLFAILSDRPFQRTRDSLTRNHATGSRDLSREPEARDLSGEVAEALVADLDSASRDRLPGLDFNTDTYALDVRRWATLPLLYRIVDPEKS